MQIKAKKKKKIRVKPSGFHIDYQRIIDEAIKSIPAPIQGDKGDSIKGDKGDRGDFIKGDKGDSIKGDKGESIRGDKGDSIKGDKGDSIKGDKGKDAIVDYEGIFKAIKRQLSTDKTLADFEIKKSGNSLVITKLFKDGTRKTNRIRLPQGGGGAQIGHIFAIPLNQTLEIPVDRQFDHLGRFCVNGRKVINGRFVLGIGANV